MGTDMTMYSDPPRRVVTGNVDGKSVFLQDGPAPNTKYYDALPGLMLSIVYVADPAKAINGEETAPPNGRMIPAPGEVSLVIGTFPPDSAYASGFDPEAAGEEQRAHTPDFLATFEPDVPGMHRTPTIDYAVILDGELDLELDGETRRVKAGELVVQGGTRHAWHNPTESPASVAFIMMGVAE